MRINPFVFGVLALAIFMGTILTAQANGFWSISGKATASGEKIVATGTNPDEIKGWMTLGEISQAYGVTMGELASKFGIPADTQPTTQVKELESDTFSPELLRAWLKERMAR